MAHVLVGGVEIARDSELTGARPGRVLRSGVDTDTVTNSTPTTPVAHTTPTTNL
jgi:hypothetical protein